MPNLNFLRHESFLRDITKREMRGKPTCGRKITELLHDNDGNRTYVRLKDLMLDGKACIQKLTESIS